MDNYERDIAWLIARMPVATESSTEAFCEKVALFELDGNSENLSRALALEVIS